MASARPPFPPPPLFIPLPVVHLAPPAPQPCPRSDEQHTSHEAHQLALAAFALRSALEAGGPLGEALGLLQGLAERDPVVAAAVRAVRRCGMCMVLRRSRLPCLWPPVWPHPPTPHPHPYAWLRMLFCGCLFIFGCSANPGMCSGVAGTVAGWSVPSAGSAAMAWPGLQ